MADQSPWQSKNKTLKCHLTPGKISLRVQSSCSYLANETVRDNKKDGLRRLIKSQRNYFFKGRDWKLLQ